MKVEHGHGMQRLRKMHNSLVTVVVCIVLYLYLSRVEFKHAVVLSGLTYIASVSVSMSV